MYQLSEVREEERKTEINIPSSSHKVPQLWAPREEMEHYAHYVIMRKGNSKFTSVFE